MALTIHHFMVVSAIPSTRAFPNQIVVQFCDIQVNRGMGIPGSTFDFCYFGDVQTSDELRLEIRRQKQTLKNLEKRLLLQDQKIARLRLSLQTPPPRVPETPPDWDLLQTFEKDGCLLVNIVFRAWQHWCWMWTELNVAGSSHYMCCYRPSSTTLFNKPPRCPITVYSHRFIVCS